MKKTKALALELLRCMDAYGRVVGYPVYILLFEVAHHLRNGVFDFALNLRQNE